MEQDRFYLVFGVEANQCNFIPRFLSRSPAKAWRSASQMMKREDSKHLDRILIFHLPVDHHLTQGDIYQNINKDILLFEAVKVENTWGETFHSEQFKKIVGSDRQLR